MAANLVVRFPWTMRQRSRDKKVESSQEQDCRPVEQETASSLSCSTKYRHRLKESNTTKHEAQKDADRKRWHT